MDKIIVNNQVILMRKFIKQAKTHIINKSAKKIKALQKKKGNESQMLKYKRKVERLLKEIAILKNMKPDFVSKLALSKAKNWESVLKKKNISLEERCLSMLANYPAVKKEVDKFHFNESHLVSKIPSLILEWEAKCENDAAVKRNKADKFPKNTASFPNNIKITKKVETCVSSKPMLPHLSSKNLTRESSEEIIEQHVFDYDSAKPNFQREMKLGEFSNQNDNLAVEKEKSKKLSRDLNYNKFSHQESFIFQSRKITCNPDDACQTKSAIYETAIVKKKKQKLATNKKKPIVAPGISNIEMQEFDTNCGNHHSGIEIHNSPVDVADIKSPENTKIPLKDKYVCKQLNMKKYLHNLKSVSKNGASVNCQSIILKNDVSINNQSTILKNGSSISNKSTISENASVNNQSTILEDDISVNNQSSMSKNAVSVNNQPTIFSKLEAISRSEFKKSNSKNMNSKNTKTVAILDLSKLQDLDEIPLENSPVLEEPSEQSVTRKSDPFFLSPDDSENDDRKNSEKKTEIERPFKQRRNNINTRISDSNFRRKGLTDMSSHRFKNKFKCDFNSNKEKSSGSFWKQAKDSNLYNKKIFERKEAISEKNQFGNKRNLKFEMKKPLSKKQKNSVSSNFHPDKKNYVNKEVDDNKPVHPSWAAKQKMKESLKIGFQGKRVVFD